MYAPVRPRPKKTSITRSRAGCEKCRQRRKKVGYILLVPGHEHLVSQCGRQLMLRQCDEQRPQCRACQKLGHACNYGGQPLQFKSVFPAASSETSSSVSLPANGALRSKPGSGNLGNATSGQLGASILDFSAAGLDESPLQSHADHLASHLCPREELFQFSDDLTLSSASLQAAAARINSDNSLYDIDDLLFSPFEDSTAQLDKPAERNISDRIGRPVSPVSASVLHNGSLPTSESVDTSNQQLLYQNSWKTLCAPALPPILKYVADLRSLPDVVSWSALALAASRLSRVQPQREVDSSNKLILRPSRTHWMASQQFYCSAIHKIAAWKPTEKQQDVGTMIQAMLLLCCLESTTGNFDVFQLHSAGVQTLIMNGIEAILAVDRLGGIRLLQAWAQTKMHSWWRRCHFSTVRFLLHDVSFRIGPRLSVYLTPQDTRRTYIIAILCESYHLSVSSYVHRLDEHDLPDVDLDRQTSSKHVNMRPSELLARTLDELDTQSQLLDAWASHRANADFPVDAPGGANETVKFSSSNLEIKPFVFESHLAAMNYAYYTTARIIQAASGVKSLPYSTLQTDGSTSGETEYWSLLLLRITAGIQWKTCLEQNPFSIGLTGLLLACSLRCSNPEISKWIQSWVELHCKDETAEEGCFPVWQIWQCLCLVNEERSKGYDVVVVFQPSEDEVRQGKHDSYQNQSLASVRILRRSRVGGNYELTRRDM